MKITLETKLGDIIPEGWELREDIMCGIAGTEERVPKLQIPLKKKEEKNFEMYVEKYLAQERCLAKRVVPFYKYELLNADYGSVCFEIKIGLLKFICDELELVHWQYIELLTNISDNVLCPSQSYEATKKILTICPKEFLTSIFV